MQVCAGVNFTDSDKTKCYTFCIKHRYEYFMGGVATERSLFVSSKNKQTAHNQVYIRQIGLRPSQHMLVLPSVQSA